MQSSPPFRVPRARVEPKELIQHGHLRIDRYYWMNRKDDELWRYIQEEDRYADRMMAHTAALQETLFREIKSRVDPNEVSVPYRCGDYLYFHRYRAGLEYPVYCRKPHASPHGEEVILDVNGLVTGQPFLEVGSWEVSERQDLLAYTIDEQGGGVYDLRFRHLAGGEAPAEEIREVTDSFEWAADNATLFYVRMDETQRPYRVYRHLLGSDPAGDEMVLEEQDSRYSLALAKTKSRKYVLVLCSFSQSTEVWYQEAGRPESPFILFQGRQEDHEYDVDHRGSSWYIRTNLAAPNFRLMRTEHPDTAQEHWREVVPHRAAVLLEDFELFASRIVLAERADGLPRFRILAAGEEPEQLLGFDQPAYEASLGDNYELDSTALRYTYSSLVTPESVFDYDFGEKKRRRLKTESVLGGFSSSHYLSERVTVTAADGTEIPISVVSPAGAARDGGSPLLLTAYGAYGLRCEVDFDSALLSLLQRGWRYAVAHVRGGFEFGRAWYDAGRKLRKKNSFTDFFACARHLIAEGYTSSERLFAAGASAGGLLVAVAAQEEPDLFRGVVAEVPFVDVVTTMLDPAIPLVTSEYEEWGNPESPPDYRYMIDYSPYDRVEARSYPHLLVTTAWEDSLVQAWEPAKWVAKLRATKRGDERLLLKSAPSHQGPSGRLKRYEETALHFAFLLDLAGSGAPGR